MENAIEQAPETIKIPNLDSAGTYNMNCCIFNT